MNLSAYIYDLSFLINITFNIFVIFKKQIWLQGNYSGDELMTDSMTVAQWHLKIDSTIKLTNAVNHTLSLTQAHKLSYKPSLWMVGTKYVTVLCLNLVKCMTILIQTLTKTFGMKQYSPNFSSHCVIVIWQNYSYLKVIRIWRYMYWYNIHNQNVLRNKVLFRSLIPVFLFFVDQTSPLGRYLVQHLHLQEFWPLYNLKKK